MKRTCRILLLVASSLFLTLLCENAAAGPLQEPRPAFEVQSSTILPGDNGSEDDSTVSSKGTVKDPPLYYFYEPFPMEIGSSILQVGLSASLLPYPDSEQEIPIPGLDFQYKRCIFANISLVGYFSTSYFSNLFHAGLQWNTNSDRFSIGIANHVGFAYGFITRKDLFDDVEAYGLFDMSLLRLGYRFDDFSFSCAFVVSYVFKSQSRVNDVKASLGPEGSINDYYCTLAIEQPFLRNLRLSVGFSIGYARTPYQSWMLYNTVDEWLFVPEFFFAVQL